MSRLPADIAEGTRVMAPHPITGKPSPATIVDNLTVMYFVRFDTAGEAFVFKAEHITLMEKMD
tara:strand:+ start:486 stop:674 length:189 start_codon:yes stop_codon:yes gene_type:complete